MEVSGPTKGLVVLLVDQSARMASPSSDDRANALLYNLCIHCSDAAGAMDWFDISVLGYCSQEEDGAAIVEPVLNGVLAGRDIVSVTELIKNPGRCETINHALQDEETGEWLNIPTQRPVWVEHRASGCGPLGVALLRATLIVDRWIPNHRSSPPPFVINLSNGAFSGADPEPYAAALKQRFTELGNVILCNAVHIPSAMWTRHLPQVLPCLPRLFQMASGDLPKALRNSLRGYRSAPVVADSRCFALNDGDRMILDLVAGVAPGSRMLGNIEEDMFTEETPDGGNSQSYIRESKPDA